MELGLICEAKEEHRTAQYYFLDAAASDYVPALEALINTTSYLRPPDYLVKEYKKRLKRSRHFGGTRPQGLWASTAWKISDLPSRVTQYQRY